MKPMRSMKQITPEYFQGAKMQSSNRSGDGFHTSSSERWAYERDKQRQKHEQKKWKQKKDRKALIQRKRKEIRDKEIAYLKRGIKSDLSMSKFSAISQSKTMLNKLLSTMSKFYKNKAFPMELKSIMDKFVDTVEKAYAEFESEYVKVMESRIDEVVLEYEDVIASAVEDAEEALGTLADSEINEVVDRMYAALLEGKYNTEGVVKRQVFTWLEAKVNKTGREEQPITYWDSGDTGEVATTRRESGIQMPVHREGTPFK